MDPKYEVETTESTLMQLRRDRELRQKALEEEFLAAMQEDIQESLANRPQPTEEEATATPAVGAGAPPQEPAQGKASFWETQRVSGEQFRAVSAAARESISDPIDTIGDVLEAGARAFGFENADFSGPGKAVDSALRSVPGMDQDPQSGVGEFASEAVELGGAFKVAKRGLGLVKVLDKWGKTKAAAAGAAADFTTTDPHGRLSDLAHEFGVPIPKVMLTTDDETDFEGRLKNMTEGVGLGLFADTIGGIMRYSRGKYQLGRAVAAADDIPNPDSVYAIESAVDSAVVSRMKVETLSRIQSTINDIVEQGSTDLGKLREIAEFQGGGNEEEVKLALEALDANRTSKADVLQKLTDYRDVELAKALMSAQEGAKTATAAMVDAFSKSTDVPPAVLEAYRREYKLAAKGAEDLKEVDEALGNVATERSAEQQRAATTIPPLTEIDGVPVKVTDNVERGRTFIHIDADQVLPDGKSTKAGSVRATVDGDGFLRIWTVNLKEGFRGKGNGIKLYLETLRIAKERGLGFASDQQVSEEAKRVYAALTARGVPFKQGTRQGEIKSRFLLTAEEVAALDLNKIAAGKSTSPVAALPGERVKIGKLKVTEEDSKAFLLAKLKGDFDGMAEAITNTIRAKGKITGVDNFDTIAEEGGIQDLIAGLESQLGAGTDAVGSTIPKTPRSFQQTRSKAYELIKSDLVADGLDLDAATTVANEFLKKTNNLDAYYQAVKITEQSLANRINDFVDGAIQGNELDMAEFYRWFQAFAEVNNVRMTGRAQIGRALGSMRIKTSSRRFTGLVTKDGKRVFSDAEAIVEGAGGDKAIRDLAAAWKAHAKDTLGQRNLVRNRSRLGKEFGYAALEFYRANRLAALTSVMRNVLGGVVTTADAAVTNYAVDVAMGLKNNRGMRQTFLVPALDNLHGFLAGTRQALIGSADFADLLARPGSTLAQGNIGQAVRTGVSPTVNTRAQFVEGPRRAFSSAAFAARHRRNQGKALARLSPLHHISGFLGGQTGPKITIPQGFRVGAPGSKVEEFSRRMAGRRYGLGAVLTDAIGNTQQLSFIGQQVPDEFIKSINYHARLRVSARRAAYAAGKEGADAATYAEQLLADVDNIDFLMEQGLRSDEYLQEVALLKARAQDQAARATFSDDYNMSQTTRNVEHFLNSHPMIRLIAPFTRTPARIQSFALLERSPLGFLAPKIRAELFSSDPETKALAWSKMVLGTSIAAASAALAMEGKLTGAISTDPLDVASWEMFGQKKTNAFVTKNEDGTVTFTQPTGALEPYENLMFTMATWVELAGQLPEDERDEVGMMLGLAVAQNILNRTYFEGISSFYRDADLAMRTQDFGLFARRQLSNVATGFVPAPLGGFQSSLRKDRNPVQAEQFYEQVGKDDQGNLTIQRSSTDTLGGVVPVPSLVLSRVRSRLPETTEDALVPIMAWMINRKLELKQEPMLNFWAEPLQMPPGFGPDTVSPFLVTDTIQDPTSLKLIELGIGQNLNAEFGRILAGDGSVELTPAEINDYKRFTNMFGTDNPKQLYEEITEKLQEGLTEPDKQTKLQGELKEEISKLISEAKEDAREKLYNKYPTLGMKVLQKEHNAESAKNPLTREKAIQKEKAGTIDPDVKQLFERLE